MVIVVHGDTHPQQKGRKIRVWKAREHVFPLPVDNNYYHQVRKRSKNKKDEIGDNKSNLRTKFLQNQKRSCSIGTSATSGLISRLSDCLRGRSDTGQIRVSIASIHQDIGGHRKFNISQALALNGHRWLTDTWMAVVGSDSDFFEAGTGWAFNWMGRKRREGEREKERDKLYQFTNSLLWIDLKVSEQYFWGSGTEGSKFPSSMQIGILFQMY